MRPLLAVLAVAALGNAAWSQSPRVVVTPSAGYVWPGALFQHRSVELQLNGTREAVRLGQISVNPTAAFGGRLDVRVARGWWLFAEGARGSSQVEYGWVRVDRDLESGEQAVLRGERGNGARISAFALGASRIIRVGPGMPEVRLRLGGSFQRFDFNKRSSCVISPSGGYCGLTPDPWEERYDVRGVDAGIALRKALGWRLAMEVGGALTTGRIETESLAASLQWQDAPKRRWMRSGRAQIGLALAL